MKELEKLLNNLINKPNQLIPAFLMLNIAVVTESAGWIGSRTRLILLESGYGALGIGNLSEQQKST